MKRYIIVSTLLLSIASFTAAQTPSPVKESAGDQKLGSDINVISKETETKIKELQRELETKIKALRAEYAAKIDAIRKAAQEKKSSLQNKRQASIKKGSEQVSRAKMDQLLLEELRKKQEAAKSKPAAGERDVPPAPAPAPAPAQKTSPVVEKVVTYEDGAFNPQMLTIKAGETVIFQNKHTFAIRVASNPHPIHTSFPAFDSDTLEPGETYRFTFKESMTLNYHNHFNPGAVGQIIVQ